MVIKGKAIEFLFAGVHNAGTDGYAYIHVPGTSTPKTVYSDAALSSAITQPIYLDQYGRALVFTNGAVKVVVYDSYDNLVGTWDNLDYFNRFSGAWIDPRDYNDGSLSGTSINAVESAFSGADRTIVLAPGTWLIDADLTIQSTKTLRVECGAVLSVASGKTLTILGKLEAGLYTIFSGSGSVVLSGSKYIDAVCPQWWGAVGNGSTDDRGALQKAFDSGLPVRSPKVCYGIKDTLFIPSDADVDLGFSTIKRLGGGQLYPIPTNPMLSNADLDNGNTNIRLRNVTIDGQRDSQWKPIDTNPSHNFSGLKLEKVTYSELRGINVVSTVNWEHPQGQSANAGILVESCTDIVCYDIGGSDNYFSCIYLTGTVQYPSKRIRIFGSVTHDNCGSGITSDYIEDCEFHDIVSWNNGHFTGQGASLFSNVSINGPRCKESNIRTWKASASGLNIGHDSAGNSADDTVVQNVHSYDNDLYGISVMGSKRVQILGAVTYGNGGNGGANASLGVYDTTTNPPTVDLDIAATRIVGLVARDCQGYASVWYRSGSGHFLDNADVYHNYDHGILVEPNAQVSIGSAVRSFDNDQHQYSDRAGIYLNGAQNCLVSAECFDDQQTKTQPAGLWIDGGTAKRGGHSIDLLNSHDNINYEIRWENLPDDPRTIMFHDDKPGYVDWRFIGGRRHMYGTSVPTLAWNQGDIIWNTSPTPGGNIGWICTTAGTPGTWKAFGSISS